MATFTEAMSAPGVAHKMVSFLLHVGRDIGEDREDIGPVMAGTSGDRWRLTLLCWEMHMEVCRFVQYGYVDSSTLSGVSRDELGG